MSVLLKLKAERTNLSDATWGEGRQQYNTFRCTTKIVDVVIKVDSDKKIVSVEEGAVTGYESFYIADVLRRPPTKGMSWCGGTPGRWDRLHMPQDQCEILMAELRKPEYV